MGRPEIKSRREIDLMREAGGVVGKALGLARSLVAPGVATIDLDRAIAKVIDEAGAISAFLGYAPEQAPGPFPATSCISVNEEVVHGIPSGRKLKTGDLVSVDIGVRLKNYHGDAARTFAVGKIGEEGLRLLECGSGALDAAKALVKPGVKLGEVCGAIHDFVAARGFQVVRQFVGHGIGRRLHEPPQIPNYVTGSVEMNLVLKPGMVLAFEPMVNAGTGEVRNRGGDWPVVTRDGKPSVHFEDTVLVTPDGMEVLTSE